MIYHLTPSLAVDDSAVPISVDVAVYSIKQRERISVPLWTTAISVLQELGLNNQQIIRSLIFALSGELTEIINEETT